MRKSAHPSLLRPSRPESISWARLLKRVFEIAFEHCQNCGGELKIIAATLESAVIERILRRLGVQPTNSTISRRTIQPDRSALDPCRRARDDGV